MMAQLDSCCSAGFEGHQGTSLPPEGLGSNPLAQVPYSHHPQSYQAAKGSFPFYSHKLHIPEVESMDVAGFTEAFIQSSQAFAF
jgi:hypothetical protein